MDDGFVVGYAEECSEPVYEVVEGVAMLREDDQLSAVAVGVEHFFVVGQQVR